MPATDQVRIVYRPKTKEEAIRRVARAEAAKGPFLRLPGNPPEHKVLFRTATGMKVTVATVEMVYNDALLCDEISDNGKDGPLYRDTLDSPDHREVYEYAIKAYAQ